MDYFMARVYLMIPCLLIFFSLGSKIETASGAPMWERMKCSWCLLNANNARSYQYYAGIPCHALIEYSIQMESQVYALIRFITFRATATRHNYDEFIALLLSDNLKRKEMKHGKTELETNREMMINSFTPRSFVSLALLMAFRCLFPQCSEEK